MVSLKWLIAIVIVQFSHFIQVQCAIPSKISLSDNINRKRPRDNWDELEVEVESESYSKRPQFKFNFEEEEVPFDELLQPFLDEDTDAIDKIMESSSRDSIYSRGVWDKLIEKKSYFSVKYLLNRWYTSPTFHRKIFLDSVVNGRTALVKYLLETSFQKIQKDTTPIINAAIQNKRYKILRMMVKAKYPYTLTSYYVQQPEQHPLHLAVENDDIKAAKLVLRLSGVFIDDVDSDSNTVLHHSKSVEMCKYLIKLGADITIQNYYGQTPLDIVIKNQMKDLISFYLPSVNERLAKYLSIVLTSWNRIHCVSTVSPISRNRVLEDSFRALSSVKSWMIGTLMYKVRFEGESGIDFGGLRREWMSLLFERFFVPLPVKQEEGDNENSSANTSSSSSNSNNITNKSTFKRTLFEMIDDTNKLYRVSLDFDGPVEVYKFAGVLVGKAFLSKFPIRATLAPSIFKVIFGIKLTFEDLLDDDPYLYNRLLPCTKPGFDFESADYSFFSDDPFKPENARVVTKDNVSEFLDDAANVSLYGRYKKQIMLFVKGFRNVVNINKLSPLLDWKELSAILAGEEHVNIQDLKDQINFIHPYWTQNADMFWRVIETMLTADELLQFIKFVTGMNGLPFGGVKNLPMKIAVHDSKKALPTCSTCHFILKLPTSYTNEEELYLGFQLALTSDPEFFDCNYNNPHAFEYTESEEES